MARNRGTAPVIYRGVLRVRYGGQVRRYAGSAGSRAHSPTPILGGLPPSVCSNLISDRDRWFQHARVRASTKIREGIQRLASMAIGTIRESKGMAGNIAKSLSIGIVLIATALPHAGWAHGPSRQKITGSIEINAPPAKVWATISDFHDMSWLPGVAKTTGEGGNEPDVAKRQLVLDSGATIDESLYKYDAAEMSYSYRIDNVDVKVLPVNNYSATIVVLPAGGESKVEWRGAFFYQWFSQQ